MVKESSNEEAATTVAKNPIPKDASSPSPTTPTKLWPFLGAAIGIFLSGAVSLIVALSLIHHFGSEPLKSSIGFLGSQDVDEQINALKSQINQYEKKIGSVENNIRDLETDLKNFTSKNNQPSLETIQDLSNRLEELSAKVTSLKAPVDESSANPANLSDIREVIQKLQAQYASLKADISQLATNLEATRNQAQIQSDAYNNSLNEMNSQLARLSTTDANRVDLALMRVAILSGYPFDAELNRLSRQGLNLPAAVTQRAKDGFKPLPLHITTFRELLPLVLHRSKSAETDKGLMSSIMHSASSLITIRRIDAAEGLDASIIRMENALLSASPQDYLHGLSTLNEQAQAVLEPISSEIRLMVESLEIINTFHNAAEKN